MLFFFLERRRDLPSYEQIYGGTRTLYASARGDEARRNVLATTSRHSAGALPYSFFPLIAQGTFPCSRFQSSPRQVLLFAAGIVSVCMITAEPKLHSSNGPQCPACKCPSTCRATCTTCASATQNNEPTFKPERLTADACRWLEQAANGRGASMHHRVPAFASRNLTRPGPITARLRPALFVSVVHALPGNAGSDWLRSACVEKRIESIAAVS
jgi:hypothetical protein